VRPGVRVNEKGFFSLRQYETDQQARLRSRKLMKPCGELNRNVKVSLEWVLFGRGAGEDWLV